MKKVLTAIAASAAVIAAASGLVSCEKYVLPAISLSRDTLFVSHSGQRVELVVETNVTWYFDLDDLNPDWLAFDPLEGDGDTAVGITVEENATGQERKIVIPVKTETLQRNLVVSQSAD